MNRIALYAILLVVALLALAALSYDPTNDMIFGWFE